MASLLVITGPPGAGKSTISSILVNRAERSVLIAGDAFFGFLARGAVLPWLPEAKEQNETVTQASATAAGRFASGGFMTVYDGIVGPWLLSTFAAATGLDDLDYVIVLPQVDVCVARVATRHDHGFDDEPATRKVHAEFERARIDRRHVVSNPPGRPEEVADTIHARHRDGSLTYRCP
jgi:cytidylate kinase